MVEVLLLPFLAVTGSLLALDAKFIIERKAGDKNSSNIPLDIFSNPGGCFRPKVCTNLGARCYDPSALNVSYHCCECQCAKDTPYFYSLHSGCLSTRDIHRQTIHEICLFTLQSPGPSSIPTYRKSDDMMSKISYGGKTENGTSILQNPEIWCFPRRVYFFTRFGKDRLVFENSCSEIINIEMKRNLTNGSISHYLNFKSENSSDWQSLNGKLLKVEIICKSRNINDTSNRILSCFLFRVNGSYDDEDTFVSHHSPKICPPAPPYIPPPTTPGPPKVDPWKTISLVIGFSVASCILLIGLAVIVFVCFIKHQKKNDSLELEQADSSAVMPMLDNTDQGDAQTGVSTGEEVEFNNGNSEVGNKYVQHQEIVAEKCEDNANDEINTQLLPEKDEKPCSTIDSI